MYRANSESTKRVSDTAFRIAPEREHPDDDEDGGQSPAQARATAPSPRRPPPHCDDRLAEGRLPPGLQPLGEGQHGPLVGRRGAGRR